MTQPDNQPMRAGDEREVDRLKQRITKFKQSYSESAGPADRLREDLEEMLSRLMKQNKLVPAVIESRLKPMNSATRKAEGLFIDDVAQLKDFVGLRLVFLLTNEVAKASELIRNTFEIDKQIDKGGELKINEFGYRAVHIIARLPQAWLSNPNYSDCGRLKFEIQLRTLSQHNYGVASRVLQYQQLQAVPPTVQRSLLRLAAILELVDLEIERVSQEKQAYSVNAMKNLDTNEALNVDLIIKILEKELPEEHRVPDDPYAKLFDELAQNGVNTTGQLFNLIQEFRASAMVLNKQAAESVVKNDPAFIDEIGKAKTGVYYSQVGLVWNMLKLKNRV